MYMLLAVKNTNSRRTQFFVAVCLCSLPPASFFSRQLKLLLNPYLVSFFVIKIIVVFLQQVFRITKIVKYTAIREKTNDGWCLAPYHIPKVQSY
jgi:hypothetical protein